MQGRDQNIMQRGVIIVIVKTKYKQLKLQFSNIFPLALLQHVSFQLMKGKIKIAHGTWQYKSRHIT